MQLIANVLKVRMEIMDDRITGVCYWWYWQIVGLAGSCWHWLSRCATELFGSTGEWKPWCITTPETDRIGRPKPIQQISGWCNHSLIIITRSKNSSAQAFLGAPNSEIQRSCYVVAPSMKTSEAVTQSNPRMILPAFQTMPECAISQRTHHGKRKRNIQFFKQSSSS